MIKDLSINNTSYYFYKKLLSINFFLLVVSLVFGAYYYWFRKSIDQTVLYQIVKAIALSSILLNLPDIICYYTRSKYYGMATILVMLFFSIIGFIFTPSSFLIILIAIILLFHQIVRFITIYQHLDSKVYYFSFAVILSFIVGWSLVITFYGQNYHHPLFMEKLAIGQAHIDTLFHTAICYLFSNYNIPSTGLHGLQYIHYHYGSHIIMACLAKLINLKPIIFYNLAYPIVFIPFFFKASFIAILKLQNHLKNNTSITFLFLSVFGVTIILSPLIFNTLPGGIPFGSESYNIAIGFSLLFLTDVFQFLDDIKKNPSRYVLLLLYYSFAVVALLFLKVSIGLLFFTLISYLLFREFLLTNWKFWVYLILNLLFIYAFYKLMGESNSTVLSIKTILIYNLATIKYYFWPYFLIIIFFITNGISLNKKGYQKLKEKIKSKETIFLELLLVVSIAGALPSFILRTLSKIDIYYFVSYQFFLGTVIVIPYFFNLFPERILSLKSIPVKIFIFSSLVFYSLFPIEQLYQKYFQLAAEKNSIISEALVNKNYVFFKKLDSYPYKKNSAFYIPKNDTAYYNMQKYRPLGIYFAIPAIAGLPQLYSIPDSAAQLNYNFSSYAKIKFPNSQEEVVSEAKKLGFSHLYLVNKKSEIVQVNF